MNRQETKEIRELAADEINTVSGGAVIIDEIVFPTDDAAGAQFIGSLLGLFFDGLS
jgi:hypothetical protein